MGILYRVATRTHKNSFQFLGFQKIERRLCPFLCLETKAFGKPIPESKLELKSVVVASGSIQATRTMKHNIEETKESESPVVPSWEEVKELEPLLKHQHTFAQSGAGTKSRGYYLKKYSAILGSLMFLLLVGVGTFVVAWNRPSVDSLNTIPSSTNNEEPASEPANAVPADTMTATALGPVPVSAPTVVSRVVALPPVVIAAMPPATASYKSPKPTLIPWEVQKSHPTYVPSRIPTFTFEYIDGGLAYGAAQADGYHPEAMEGFHPDFRKTLSVEDKKRETVEKDRRTKEEDAMERVVAGDFDENETV